MRLAVYTCGYSKRQIAVMGEPAVPCGISKTAAVANVKNSGGHVPVAEGGKGSAQANTLPSTHRYVLWSCTVVAL